MSRTERRTFLGACAATASLAVLVGCDSGRPDAVEPATETESVELVGFDPGQEPVLRTMSDGTMEVRFNRLPPNAASGDGAPIGAYGEVDRDLAEAIGTEVEWPERRMLLIPNPADDTADRVKTFFETYKP